MTDLRKAAEMALEALEGSPELLVDWLDKLREVREALRQALAQPEQEPVAWLWKNIDGHQVLTDDPDYADGTWTPLYTAPPKREWVGLTRRELDIATLGLEDLGDCYKAIEAKLKEKNV